MINSTWLTQAGEDDLFIPIPKGMLDQLNLVVGDSVVIEITDDCITVKKVIP